MNVSRLSACLPIPGVRGFRFVTSSPTFAKITLVWRETVNEAGKRRSAALASQLCVEPPPRDPVAKDSGWRRHYGQAAVAGRRRPAHSRLPALRRLARGAGGGGPRIVVNDRRRGMAGRIFAVHPCKDRLIRCSGRRRSGSSGAQGDLYRDGLRLHAPCRGGAGFQRRTRCILSPNARQAAIDDGTEPRNTGRRIQGMHRARGLWLSGPRDISRPYRTSSRTGAVPTNIRQNPSE
jgi:hypothetical protein